MPCPANASLSPPRHSPRPAAAAAQSPPLGGRHSYSRTPRPAARTAAVDDSDDDDDDGGGGDGYDYYDDGEDANDRDHRDGDVDLVDNDGNVDSDNEIHQVRRHYRTGNNMHGERRGVLDRPLPQRPPAARSFIARAQDTGPAVAVGFLLRLLKVLLLDLLPSVLIGLLAMLFAPHLLTSPAEEDRRKQEAEDEEEEEGERAKGTHATVAEDDAAARTRAARPRLQRGSSFRVAVGSFLERSGRLLANAKNTRRAARGEPEDHDPTRENVSRSFGPVVGMSFGDANTKRRQQAPMYDSEDENDLDNIHVDMQVVDDDEDENEPERDRRRDRKLDHDHAALVKDDREYSINHHRFFERDARRVENAGGDSIVKDDDDEDPDEEESYFHLVRSSHHSSDEAWRSRRRNVRAARPLSADPLESQRRVPPAYQVGGAEREEEDDRNKLDKDGASAGARNFEMMNTRSRPRRRTSLTPASSSASAGLPTVPRYRSPRPPSGSRPLLGLDAGSNAIAVPAEDAVQADHGFPAEPRLAIPSEQPLVVPASTSYAKTDRDVSTIGHTHALRDHTLVAEPLTQQLLEGFSSGGTRSTAGGVMPQFSSPATPPPSPDVSADPRLVGSTVQESETSSPALTRPPAVRLDSLGGKCRPQPEASASETSRHGIEKSDAEFTAKDRHVEVISDCSGGAREKRDDPHMSDTGHLSTAAGSYQPRIYDAGIASVATQKTLVEPSVGVAPVAMHADTETVGGSHEGKTIAPLAAKSIISRSTSAAVAVAALDAAAATERMPNAEQTPCSGTRICHDEDSAAVHSSPVTRRGDDLLDANQIDSAVRGSTSGSLPIAAGWRQSVEDNANRSDREYPTAPNSVAARIIPEAQDRPDSSSSAKTTSSDLQKASKSVDGNAKAVMAGEHKSGNLDDASDFKEHSRPIDGSVVPPGGRQDASRALQEQGLHNSHASTTLGSPASDAGGPSVGSTMDVIEGQTVMLPTSHASAEVRTLAELPDAMAEVPLARRDIATPGSIRLPHQANSEQVVEDAKAVMADEHKSGNLDEISEFTEHARSIDGSVVPLEDKQDASRALQKQGLHDPHASTTLGSPASDVGGPSVGSPMDVLEGQTAMLPGSQASAEVRASAKLPDATAEVPLARRDRATPGSIHLPRQAKSNSEQVDEEAKAVMADERKSGNLDEVTELKDHSRLIDGSVVPPGGRQDASRTLPKQVLHNSHASTTPGSPASDAGGPSVGSTMDVIEGQTVMLPTSHASAEVRTLAKSPDAMAEVPPARRDRATPRSIHIPRQAKSEQVDENAKAVMTDERKSGNLDEVPEFKEHSRSIDGSVIPPGGKQDASLALQEQGLHELRASTTLGRSALDVDRPSVGVPRDVIEGQTVMLPTSQASAEVRTSAELPYAMAEVPLARGDSATPGSIHVPRLAKSGQVDEDAKAAMTDEHSSGNLGEVPEFKEPSRSIDGIIPPGGKQAASRALQEQGLHEPCASTTLGSSASDAGGPSVGVPRDVIEEQTAMLPPSQASTEVRKSAKLPDAIAEFPLNRRDRATPGSILGLRQGKADQVDEDAKAVMADEHNSGNIDEVPEFKEHSRSIDGRWELHEPLASTSLGSSASASDVGGPSVGTPMNLIEGQTAMALTSPASAEVRTSAKLPDAIAEVPLAHRDRATPGASHVPSQAKAEQVDEGAKTVMADEHSSGNLDEVSEFQEHSRSIDGSVCPPVGKQDASRALQEQGLREPRASTALGNPGSDAGDPSVRNTFHDIEGQTVMVPKSQASAEVRTSAELPDAMAEGPLAFGEGATPGAIHVPLQAKSEQVAELPIVPNDAPRNQTGDAQLAACNTGVVAGLASSEVSNSNRMAEKALEPLMQNISIAVDVQSSGLSHGRWVDSLTDSVELETSSNSDSAESAPHTASKLSSTDVPRTPLSWIQKSSESSGLDSAPRHVNKKESSSGIEHASVGVPSVPASLPRFEKESKSSSEPEVHRKGAESEEAGDAFLFKKAAEPRKLGLPISLDRLDSAKKASIRRRMENLDSEIDVELEDGETEGDEDRPWGSIAPVKSQAKAAVSEKKHGSSYGTMEAPTTSRIARRIDSNGNFIKAREFEGDESLGDKHATSKEKPAVFDERSNDPVGVKPTAAAGNMSATGDVERNLFGHDPCSRTEVSSREIENDGSAGSHELDDLADAEVDDDEGVMRGLPPSATNEPGEDTRSQDGSVKGSNEPLFPALSGPLRQTERRRSSGEGRARRRLSAVPASFAQYIDDDIDDDDEDVLRKHQRKNSHSMHGGNVGLSPDSRLDSGVGTRPLSQVSGAASSPHNYHTDGEVSSPAKPILSAFGRPTSQTVRGASSAAILRQQSLHADESSRTRSDMKSGTSTPTSPYGRLMSSGSSQRSPPGTHNPSPSHRVPPQNSPDRARRLKFSRPTPSKEVAEVKEGFKKILKRNRIPSPQQQIMTSAPSWKLAPRKSPQRTESPQSDASGEAVRESPGLRARGIPASSLHPEANLRVASPSDVSQNAGSGGVGSSFTERPTRTAATAATLHGTDVKPQGNVPARGVPVAESDRSPVPEQVARSEQGTKMASGTATPSVLSRSMLLSSSSSNAQPPPPPPLPPPTALFRPIAAASATPVAPVSAEPPASAGSSQDAPRPIPPPRMGPQVIVPPRRHSAPNSPLDSLRPESSSGHLPPLPRVAPSQSTERDACADAGEPVDSELPAPSWAHGESLDSNVEASMLSDSGPSSSAEADTGAEAPARHTVAPAVTQFVSGHPIGETVSIIGEILMETGCTVSVKRNNQKMKVEAPYGYPQKMLYASISMEPIMFSGEDGVQQRTVVTVMRAKDDKGRTPVNEFVNFFHSLRARAAEYAEE